MIALTLLLLALGWLLVTAIAGYLAYRGTRKRWVHVATTLVILWLPFWDVIPGWILYQKAVREVGGVRIYRTVEAEGYLDRSATDCYSCWSQLKDSPYRYLEIERTVDGGALPAIEQGPGYYEYRLFPRGDAECAAFDTLPNSERIRSNHGLGNSCVRSMFSSMPISRYEVWSERSIYRAASSLWPVRIYLRGVRDRVTDQILAESVQVYFTSWLGRLVGIPRWQFTELSDGRHIEIKVRSVLLPS